MSTFFISDQHFRHNNILQLENRPFTSLEEMESSMIKAWNDVVRKNDEVMVLGDFCFGNHKAWIEILDQLKGKVTLIKGNHCSSKVVNKVINEGYIHEYHPLGTVMKVEKHILNLSHYPMEIGNRPRNWSIHGHIHSYNGTDANMINVGVDNNFAKSFNRPFGTPISLEELVDRLNEYLPRIEELYKLERELW